jgi:adenylate kinase family enzyme
MAGNHSADANQILPAAMERTIVVGTTGSGKTTLARRLSTILDVPHIELDSLYWGPDWQPRDLEQFRVDVAAAVAADRWVLDGNYSYVRPITWPRATHIVWLNYSFPRVMFQLTRRTISRALTGVELFAGNRESLKKSFFSRESIILWGLTTYHRRRQSYPELFKSPQHAHLHVIEFRTPAATEKFAQSLSRQKSAPE